MKTKYEVIRVTKHKGGRFAQEKLVTTVELAPVVTFGGKNDVNGNISLTFTGGDSAESYQVGSEHELEIRPLTPITG